jgi:hypothetical protein
MVNVVFVTTIDAITMIQLAIIEIPNERFPIVPFKHRPRIVEEDLWLRQTKTSGRPISVVVQFRDPNEVVGLQPTT